MKIKNENMSLIGIMLMFLIATFIYFEKVRKEKEVEKFKIETIGKIIDFNHSNTSYYLTYEFYYGGRRYENTINVSYFKCFDGTVGCKGKEFTIFYSSINPNNNTIDLKEYNGFKR